MAQTSQEFKIFIEKVKSYLREKREKDRRGSSGVCTLEEVMKHMSIEERNVCYQFNSANYLNTTFNEAIKNNPKIHFDLGRRTFSFKNQFHGVNDLIEKLYQTKMGVVEGQDLFDDIDKEDLEKLARDGLLRKIIIKEKKSKPTITLLYSKNHTNDQVDKLNLEERTPQVLREYWDKISKDEVERMDTNKRSAVAYLNRHQPDKPKKGDKKKSRRSREEENVNEWQNRHLADKIEEARKMLSKRGPEVKKLKKTGGTK